MRRHLFRALRVFGVALVFVAALVLGVVAHSARPAARRLIVAQVNAILAPLFVGKLTIERIGSIGLESVHDVDARMDGADGKVVIHASGVDGQIALGALLRSVLHHETILVDIGATSVQKAEVNLDEEADGVLRIVRAFQPRTPSPPPAPSEPPGPGVRLTIGRARIEHGTARGQMSGLPPIDADLDAADGSLSVTSDKVTIDVTGAHVLARSLPAVGTAQGGAEFHLLVPSPTGAKVGLRAAFDGTVAAIAARGAASLDGSALDATVDVPAAGPDPMRAVLPGWPLVVPAGLHATAKGELPELAVQAHATAAGASLDVSGPIGVGPNFQGTLSAKLANFDASAVLAGAPATDFTLSTDATIVEKTGGALEVKAAIDAARGRVGTTPTPPLAVTATLARGASGALTVDAHSTLREPGLPTTLHARLDPRGHSFVVTFDADTNAGELGSASRLGNVARGRARAHVEGTLDLGAGAIDARVAVAGEDLAAFGVRAGGGRAELHVTGLVAAPVVDADVVGTDVHFGPMELPEMHGQARVSLFDGPTLRDVRVQASAPGQSALASATLVRVTGDEVRVEGAELRGFGAPVRATIYLSPRRLFVQADCTGIDLAGVGRFANVSEIRSGRVSFDVDATVNPGSAVGRVGLQLAHGAFSRFDDTNAQIDAKLDGRRASGHVMASVEDIGLVDLRSSSIEVGKAGPLSLAGWRQAFGAIETHVHFDINMLLAQFKDTLPFGRVFGLFDMSGLVERDSAEDWSPQVNLNLQTTGLVVLGPGKVPAWRVEGIDPNVRVLVDGRTAKTAVDLFLRDSVGPFFTAAVKSNDVPYAALFRGEDPVAALLAMPIDAQLEVPQRRMETLPDILDPNDLHGLLRAKVGWKGSVSKPVIEVAGSLMRGDVDANASSFPFDLVVSGWYEGARADLSLKASQRERVMVDALARVDARASDLVAGLAGDAPVPWTASARARLDSVPLRTLQVLSDRQVRGRVSGDLKLDRLHDDARASAAITFESLTVGEVPCKAARLSVSIDGQAFDGGARIDQDDGYLDVHAHSGAHWGKDLLPTIDPAVETDVSLQARQFRAAFLFPFVSGVFSELDGRIDADAKLTVEPTTRVAHPQGTVALSAGEFEMTSLGGEFSDVSAMANLTPDGVITIKNAVAHGISGQVQAAATARLNGLAFAGGRATIRVARNQALPIVFDGVQVGTLDGNFDVTANPGANGDALDVTVVVPTVHVELPLAGAHDVQALGELEGVTTGVRHPGSKEFVPIALDGTGEASEAGARAPIRIAIQLGSDVSVARGTDLSVRMQGDPVIVIADKVTASGQIGLVSGTLEVQGKAFEIEKGTVTFSGDEPSNPQVVLTAGWSAQDGTRVYADFVGPLKTGKVTLRSEPARSQNDILALILYGSTDADTGNGTSQFSTVAGAAGGAATQPINRALGGVNRMLDNLGLAGGLTTKIDTSQATPRPEVGLQIARDISLQIAWVIGTPPPGTSNDTTLVTLNWQFLRRWSLETTFGDKGTSILDLVWQYRY